MSVEEREKAFDRWSKTRRWNDGTTAESYAKSAWDHQQKRIDELEETLVLIRDGLITKGDMMTIAQKTLAKSALQRAKE